MNISKAITLIFFFLSISISQAQFLIPGYGISDVKLGADRDEIEWELGFKGKKVASSDAPADIAKIAGLAEVDFDFLAIFNHLMWLPVTELLFRDGKVCMIRLSSIPAYNQMLCADIGTEEGLNFWDTSEQFKSIYKSSQIYTNGSKTVILDKTKGLGVELHENEVRTMFIFQSQIE